MDLENSYFNYKVIIKKEQQISFKIDGLFKNLTDICFASKPFSSYTECLNSCKKISEDITKNINEGDPRTFKVGSEVNPSISGKETLSDVWAENEVTRFWIFDKMMEGSKIEAVARASIFAIPEPENSRILN